MARAIPEAMKLDPAACRAHAMTHFDRDKIARQHVTLYEALCSAMPNPKGDPTHANGLVYESLGVVAP